jgi:hypothetical protein
LDFKFFRFTAQIFGGGAGVRFYLRLRLIFISLGDGVNLIGK